MIQQTPCITCTAFMSKTRIWSTFHVVVTLVASLTHGSQFAWQSWDVKKIWVFFRSQTRLSVKCRRVTSRHHPCWCGSTRRRGTKWFQRNKWILRSVGWTKAVPYGIVTDLRSCISPVSTKVSGKIFKSPVFCVANFPSMSRLSDGHQWWSHNDLLSVCCDHTEEQVYSLMEQPAGGLFLTLRWSAYLTATPKPGNEEL